MKRVSLTARISVTLVCLTLSVLLVAQSAGLIPDTHQAALEHRKVLCESIAIQCSLAVGQGDLALVHATATALRAREPDILSLAVRDASGTLLVEVGQHAKHWTGGRAGDRSDAVQVQVPIFKGAERWGAMEVAFAPIGRGGFMGVVGHPIFKLCAFVALFGFAAYSYYLRKTLQYLDPTSVIPERVKLMLDTHAEGVIVLDRDERILLANESFGVLVGRPTENLVGLKASSLSWSWPPGDDRERVFPWVDVMEHKRPVKGVCLILAASSSATSARTVMANCAPILGGDGTIRGTLVTLDDMTAVEQKNAQLRQMLQQLQDSRDEIERKNKELHELANTDALTGCLNRRSFFEQFQQQWSGAQRYGHALSCVMLDIDRFKRINDEHGHTTGDQILQQVAGVLRGLVRPSDVVGRYGGEEFCILLPHVDAAGALAAAERFRVAIQAKTMSGLSVTASLGASGREHGADDPQAMLNQADQALYAAKRGGRNRCVAWSRELDAAVAAAEAQQPPEALGAAVEARRASSPLVPFHAVTALLSVLTQRDRATADHSRRVADLCVNLGRGLMSVRDCYQLEVAALLHDIGKLGVPDAILLKPGPLTAEEWKIMRAHERMGVEIVSSAFTAPDIAQAVRTHHAWYGGNPRDPGLPVGDAIPLPARVLAIADAYDAMVSDRVYRRGRTRDQAVAELRR
jgi:diguanylate cyclase (GGDEF)-like protein/putative nucleotidyltransferase with HDIG domain